MSQAQNEIQKHLEAIEKIKATQFRQELIDVLSDKKSTEEQVATSAKAFYDNYMHKVRQANLVKARAERVRNPPPTPTQ